MNQPFAQVDAFADKPFAGNPAAVFVLPEQREDAWMQSVAAEMNLPMTAFLVRRADGFGLRWFTPTIEMPLCGHATLASAHILWQEGHLPPGVEARFHTQSGVLTANQVDGWIELNFPQIPLTTVTPPAALVEALGVTPLYTSQDSSNGRYLVEVASEAIVRAAKPNFALLASLPSHGTVITSRASTAGYDFVSRFFAPVIGIDEDSVTGSAHCSLTPYWTRKLGRDTLVGYQASKRGGVVRVRQDGDRVRLAGQAVTVLRGDLIV